MEETQTLNAEASSPSDHTPAGELISTVVVPTATDTDPEGAKNTQAQPAAPAADPKGETKPEDGDKVAKGDSERFDKHPRFVELNRRVKSFDEENRLLKAELDQIKAKLETPATPDPPPFKDWSKMSEDELLDWQSSDPKGFIDNFLRRTEVAVKEQLDAYKQQIDQQHQQKAQQETLVKTYESYAKANPDFDEMWDDGRIQAFMDKNPGHNAISAHQMLTEETRLKAAADKAVKEFEGALRSKRAASAVLGAGNMSVPTDAKAADERLKNPKKFGGVTEVLTARLLERRRAAGRA